MSKKNYLYIVIILALLCNCSGNKTATQEFHWKVYSVYSEDNPIYKESIDDFADDLREMTNGKFTVEYLPANPKTGHDVNSFDVFDKVSSGEIDMGFGTTPYWKKRSDDKMIPGTEFMYATPFGMTAEGMYAWLFRGKGLELWRKIYEEYGVVPIPVGNVGGIMGGWFRNEIKSVADFKNLKMRLSGPSVDVLEALGVIVKECPSSQALERFKQKEFDSILVLGPYADQHYGLDGEGGPKYYYYPGWQEPGAVVSIIVNKKKWDSLPDNFKKAFEVLCEKTYHSFCYEFYAYNSISLDFLQTTRKDLHIKKFPPAVLAELKKTTDEIYRRKSENSTQFKKVYDSFCKFKESYVDSGWSRILDEAVYSSWMPDLANSINELNIGSVYQEGNRSIVISLRKGDLLFSSSSSAPTKALRNGIKKISEKLSPYRLSIKIVKVEGYSSAAAGDNSDDWDLFVNWEMSKKRVNSVIHLLKQNGLDSGLLKAVYYGDSQASTGKSTGIDRRVDIVVEF